MYNYPIEKVPLYDAVENAIELLAKYTDLGDINIFQNIDTSLCVKADIDVLSETIYVLFKKIIISSREMFDNRKICIYVDVYTKNQKVHLSIQDNIGTNENLEIKTNKSIFDSFSMSHDNDGVNYKISFS